MTGKTGEITYYARQEGTVWIFTPAPDPRDVEIADLRRWLEIKQSTAEGLGKLAREYQQQAIDAQARIAELEAALRGIRAFLAQYLYPAYSDLIVMAMVDKVLMPSPERDMAITQEELPA